MSIRLNGSFVEMINTKEDDIALIKLNGQVLFPNSNQINLSYINNVFYIKGYYGEYELRYANDDGPLEDYDRIGVVNVHKDEADLPYLMTLNVAPKEADKIIVCRKNTTEVVSEIEIPNTLKMVDLGEKLYSFGALSDVHIDGDGTDEASASGDFARALQFFNENASLVCISGDLTITSESAENELSMYKNLVDNNAHIPVYASRGNHDCRFTIEEFETYTGGTLYFERTYNNDVFIFLGMNAENYGDNCFTKEELDWLENKLESYKNQRVFLFFHVFMDDTCGNIDNLYPYSNLDTSKNLIHRFDALMVKYRNVIFFSGHSHLEFYCQRLGPNANVYSNGSICHRVHIPSCAKPRVNYEGGSSHTYTFYAGSEGYLVDVYKDYIVLKGVNFIKGKFVPIANYLLNTSEFEIVDNNLYDYLRDNTGNGWISEGEGKLYLTNSNSRYSYIDIKPNTTYTITKMFGSRLRVGTSEVEPTSEMILSNVMKNDAGVDLTITTGEKDKYLLIEYWYRNLDGETELDYRRSITVEKLGGEIIGVNLFDGVWSKGYFTNEGEVWNSDDGGYGPQYMNVSDNSTLYILFNTLQEHELGRLFINEYDENMTFIQRIVPVNADVLPVGVTKYTATLNESTRYIRVSFYKIDDLEDSFSVVNDYFQLALSTTELDEYVPYVDDNLLKLHKDNAEWVAYAGTEASATFNTNNTISINADGSDSWGLNISQPGLTLKAGTTYRLSCDNLESSTWISVNNKDNMMIRKSLPSIDFTPSEDIIEPKIMIWVDTGTVYTNTTWNIKIVEVIDESNLWINAIKTNNLYPDSDLGTFVTGDATYSSAYIVCEPNTEYKITRTMDGYRFRILETTEIPQENTTYNNLVKSDSLKEVFYTTSSTAKYLVVYYGGSSETLDRDALFNDIVVTKVETEVETSNLFKTSAILYSSSGSQYTSGKDRGGVVYTYETNSENLTVNGTPTYSDTQGFKVTNTLIAGKTYKLYAEVVSGSVSLGSKNHSLWIELKTNYTGEALCSCYTDSLDTSTMPEIGTYTPTSDISEWYIMISHRSSEVVYSNYTIAIHVEEVTDPVNLYDYSTASTLDAYISRSSYTVKSSTTDKTTYLQIEPNSKYKVTKTASSRFVIGTFSDVPEIGGASGSKVIDDYTGTTLYITSGENDNYLAIQYYVTSDTLTEEALRQSIQVLKVENTTENNLMPDFVASSGTVAGVTYNFIEGTNKFTLSGTASSSSHIYSPEFVMNLIVGKTYAFRFNIVSGSIDASAHEDSYYDKNLISVDDTGATAKMVEKDDVETPFHEQQFVVTQTYPYYKIDIKLKSNDIYTNTEIEVEVVQLD